MATMAIRTDINASRSLSSSDGKRNITAHPETQTERAVHPPFIWRQAATACPSWPASGMVSVRQPGGTAVPHSELPGQALVAVLCWTIFLSNVLDAASSKLGNLTQSTRR